MRNGTTKLTLWTAAIALAMAWVFSPSGPHLDHAFGLYKQAGNATPILDSEYPDLKSCERAVALYMNAVGGPVQQWGCKPSR